MAFTSVTLTLDGLDPSFANLVGKVTATLSVPELANGSQVIGGVPVIGVISEGILTNDANQPFDLAALDDSGTAPTGAYYTFSVEFDGMIDPIVWDSTVSASDAPSIGLFALPRLNH